MKLKEITYKGVKLQYPVFDIDNVEDVESLSMNLIDQITDMQLEEDEDRQALMGMRFQRSLMKESLTKSEYAKWSKLNVREFSEAMELGSDGDTVPKD